MKIAIVTPEKNALTETFIGAHISLLKGEKIVYHGGKIPLFLDSTNLFLERTYAVRFIHFVKKFFHASPLSPVQQVFLTSLKKSKPNVILAEYGVQGADVTPIVSALKIPLVVHFHGYDASDNSVLKSYADKYQKMFYYASAIIVVSDIMRKKLESIGCPSSKIVLSYCGPNWSFFENSPTYKSEKFLAVGRFVDKKSPHLTILAFRRVLSKYPNAKLTMIGNGPLYPVCKDLIREFHIESSVELLDAQNSDFIRKEMNDSICLVQHSRTAESGDMEGTPVVVLEAQAAALPVVATRHAGIPDVVIEEETGLLLDEGDIEAMSTSMIRILQEKGLAERLGKAARKRIQTHFTMDQHISTLQKTLENAARDTI
jgi:colanic acid/amylovoran biosynthesis glycosyltransferase